MSFGTFGSRIVAVVLGVLALFLVVGTFQHPPADVFQRGYRGTGIIEVYNPAQLAAQQAANRLPEATEKAEASGQKAGDAFENVRVLKDVDSAEFLRLMTDITAWVAPNQGCGYCHAEGEPLSSDKLYTKIVARRMLQMTMHINADWKTHVAETGVTCYTCHRGQPVPSNIWFRNEGPPTAAHSDGDRADQNWPNAVVGMTSLPFDPFTPFLDQSNDVRVVSQTALPEGDHHSIKQTEWTYALMMNISQALGVNCTFCHNSRSFTAWDQSTPARQTAYYGIRMVRDINTGFLDGLTDTFPHDRLGPLGDGPKVNCATCHQGIYKPLFGASMLGNYPELAGSATAPKGQ
jgi:photosynthetic reaction center cytochrome c subunit